MEEAGSLTLLKTASYKLLLQISETPLQRFKARRRRYGAGSEPKTGTPQAGRVHVETRD